MHKFKTIIAFLFTFGSAFFLGIGTEKILDSFYPNKPDNTEYIEIMDDKDRLREVTPAIYNEDVITADTKLLIVEADIDTGEEIASENNIPVKYIGLNRVRFLEEMKIYEKSPALSDVKKGFQNLEVLSFSSKEIVVQKNYIKNPSKKHFYMIAKDNKLIVYYQDMETVFLTTDIPLDVLPEQVSLEVLQKTYFETEEELYNFLESYSS